MIPKRYSPVIDGIIQEMIQEVVEESRKIKKQRSVPDSTLNLENCPSAKTIRKRAKRINSNSNKEK